MTISGNKAVLLQAAQKAKFIQTIIDNHPNPVQAVDGSETFDELKNAAFLFANYKFNSSDMQSLDKACTLGLYDALLERLTIIKKAAQNNSVPIDIAMNDAKRLAMLYWSTGCVEAATKLMQLGNITATRPDQAKALQDFSENNKKNISTQDKEPDCVVLWKKAIEYYLLTLALQNYSPSQEIKKQIQPNAPEYDTIANEGLKILSSLFTKLFVPTQSFLNKKQVKIDADIKSWGLSENESKSIDGPK